MLRAARTMADRALHFTVIQSGAGRRAHPCTTKARNRLTFWCKEWVTAGCLGHMRFDNAQAKITGNIFALSDEEQKWLQVVPYKGSLPTPVPTDPLIYR